jgi:hypothetical protein
MSSITGSSSRLITKLTIGALHATVDPLAPLRGHEPGQHLGHPQSDILGGLHRGVMDGRERHSVPKLRIAVSGGGNTRGWLASAYSKRFRSNLPSTDLDFSSALDARLFCAPARRSGRPSRGRHRWASASAFARHTGRERPWPDARCARRNRLRPERAGPPGPASAATTLAESPSGPRPP